MRLSFAAAALIALGSVCARKPTPESQLSPLPARALSGLAGQPLVVLPTRYLRPSDALGWGAQLPDPREFLARVDDEMAFAVRQRNGAPQWTWPEELSRLARRNPTYAPEPHDIAADPLRPTGKTSARRAQDMLPDPLRSQLRALVALRDARYALVPVEIRFEPRGGGAGRAVLHLALVDTRAAQVVWAGDVASDSATGVTPALAASLGERFADLVAAP